MEPGSEPPHRVLSVVAWLWLGTQVGLCISGTAFDLLWETPLAFMTWILFFLFVPAVVVINLAQMLVGLLVAVAVGGVLRGSADARSLSRASLVAGGLCLVGAAVVGGPGWALLPGLVTTEEEGAWLVAFLPLAMTWELLVPAAGWLGIAVLARVVPQGPLERMPSRDALALSSPVLLCATAMATIWPTFLATAMAMQGASSAASNVVPALGYLGLRGAPVVVGGLVGTLGLVSLVVDRPRAHLVAATLQAVTALGAVVVYVMSVSLPAVVAVGGALPLSLWAMGRAWQALRA